MNIYEFYRLFPYGKGKDFLKALSADKYPIKHMVESSSAKKIPINT